MYSVGEIYRLLRWRLVGVRYLGKIGRFLAAPSLPRRATVPVNPSAAAVALRGYAPGPRIADADIEALRAIYEPRGSKVQATQSGHPFANLMRPEDLTPENPALRFALSPEVLDAAHDYFGGNFRFDSVLVLHSFPTEGKLRESQMWHRDYGDSKSLHCVAYVNDVLEPEDGPFVYVDRRDTKRIAPSPLIRRIPDEKFARELGPGVIRTFFGRSGESVFVDPAACYHLGSRCKRPRLALFATFNTDRPFVAAEPLLRQNHDKVLAAAQAIRPDLPGDYLKQILAV